MVPAAVVWLSYGVSSSYVLADAIDKGKKAGEVSASLPLDTRPPPPGHSQGGLVPRLACDTITVVGIKHVDSPYPSPVCRIVHPPPSLACDICLYPSPACGQVYPQH